MAVGRRFRGRGALFVLAVIGALLVPLTVTKVTAVTVYGPNLVANPSLESGNKQGPSNWSKSRRGTNNATFSYLTGGAQNGTRSVRTQITSYTSGDAQTYFNFVTVAPNTRYEVRQWYTSTTTTYPVVTFQLTTGATQTLTAPALPAAAAWTQYATQFTTPANVRSVSLWHQLRGVGALTVDNAYLGTATEVVDLPTVSISAPAAGATVSNTVNVAAALSSTTGVAGVQFRAGTTAIGAEDTTAPYEAAWNTTQVANGTVGLTAVVRMTDGRTTTSPVVNVTVSNVVVIPLPTVAISAPAGGTTVAGTVNVAATLSAATGVAGVQFRAGSAAIGAEDTTSPYAVGWDTTATANGAVGLTAVVRMTDGRTTTSPVVNVTVSNVVVVPLPTVAVSAPAAGSTVSGTVDVAATLSSATGVAGVQFRVGSTAIGAEDTTSPYAASWSTTTTPNGSVALTAVVRMTDGRTTTSPTVDVTVSNSTGGGNPTLPATPKIMAIGDSITNGLNTQNGMLSARYPLQDRFRAAACRYDMVGPYNGLYNGEVIAGYDNQHAARAGDKSWHGYWELPGWMTTYNPDVALIFIGHNDLYGEVTLNGRSIPTVVAETVANVETKIGQLRTGNPNIDIYLAKITPSGLVVREAFVALNDGYAALAARLTTATSPITTVDMYTGFDPTQGVDTYDGVHPNLAGDAKIGQRWYDAMRPALVASSVCGS